MALNPPRNLRVIVSDTWATMLWELPDGDFLDQPNNGYDIQVSDGTGGVLLSNANLTRYTYRNLSPNRNYTFRIRATSGSVIDGTRMLSSYASVSARTRGEPLVVENVRATNVGSRGATISWDAVDDATGYQVTVGGITRTTSGTSLNVTGLSGETTYKAVVVAQGLGSPQGTTTFTTGLIQPLPPSQLRISDITATSMKLDWNGSFGATEYRIFLNGFLHATVTAPTVTYTATQLSQNTVHTWTVSSVRTYNDGSEFESRRSIAQSAETSSFPGEPVITVTNLTDDGFDLSWDATNADSYELEIDGAETTPDTATTHSVTGLDEYEEYTVKVTAVNNSGKTAAERTVRTAFLIPGASTLTADTPLRTSLTWNWTAAQDATRYKITRSDGVEVFVTDLTYTWTGLSSAEEYTLTVTPQREYSPGLFSDGSSVSLAVQTAPPVNPGLLQTQVGDVDDDSIEVEYTAGSDTTGITFIIVPADAAAQTVVVVDGDTGSVTFDGLESDSEYTITATPFNSDGNGTPNIVIARTTLAAPTGLATQNIAPGQVLVTWNDVDGAADYNLVFYTTVNGLLRTTDTFPENQRVVLNLINGISWTFEVRAVRGGVLGAAATITATPSSTASAAISGNIPKLPAPAPLSRFHTFSQEDIDNAIIAMMPPGLPCEADSNNRTWLDAVAYGERVKIADIQRMLSEIYPATSDDAISDWEDSVYSADCYTPSPALLERRIAVILKLRQRGGNTLAYLRDTAAEYGFGGVTTEEDFAFRAGVNVAGDKLGADQVVIGWNTQPPTANDDAVEQLACILRETKLLHVRMFINNDTTGATRTEV